MFALLNPAAVRRPPRNHRWRLGCAFASFGAACGLIAAVWPAPGCGLVNKPAVVEPEPEPNGESTAVESPNPSGQTGGRSSVFERPLQKLVVEFKVHRFSAPGESFSGDEQIWRLVTGPLADAAMALRLADNGFRAAVGQESDRAALREYLDGLQGVRSALDTATPDASRMVEINVGTCPARQTIFFYDRQGRLHGLDFENAEARFKLAFEMRSPNLREVWIEIIPEIEEPPGPPRWVITDQGAKQEPRERRYTFDELAFSAQVPEGGFLIVGPARAINRRPLLALPFLVEEKPGPDEGSPEIRESIYVISPIIRSYGQGR